MKIAICEDEEYQRDIIEGYILNHESQYPGITITAYKSGEELLDAYRQGEQYDFLFMDIQMKEIDGIKTAQEIKKHNRHLIIFFITGYTKYVSAAFSLNAFQFLIKPVRQDLFDREFERAIRKYHREHQKYVINNKTGTISLEIKDVMYLESSNHQIIVHTEDNEYIKTNTMNDEEKRLTPYGFVRTHQSFMVNMAYITEITEGDAVLNDGRLVMVSARKRTEVLNCFNQFLAGYSV